MNDITPEDLRTLQPEQNFFIGVDSDGCVFDSMELKHKECFCPAFINHFRLQGACGAARETWEFVNLYSRTRGLNRFKAVVEALRLLDARPEVRERIGAVMDPADLEAWIAVESKLGTATLETYLCEQGDALSPDSLLHPSLNWTRDVAEAVERIVHDLPPITEAVRTLERIHGKADCLVVSQTPTPDLVREWREHDIDRFTRVICGQELGTKEEHLALAAGGKYPDGHVLMVGDAPGDHDAARANGFLFFPIVPGDESASWQELRTEGLDRFFSENFAGDYQEQVLKDFYRQLPEHPPWTSDLNLE
ncbi:HAD family hydrolase [Kiritimatiellaeota bacterium B1221]|nr:HAD family hydrolase [Kiritimatiellaeota bacterium B1221]